MSGNTELAAQAGAALRRAGYGDVTVLCGDGELGAPEYHPYQGIIATAAARTVPYQWVEQAAEGGRIVFPYTGPHHPAGVAVLTVREGMPEGQVTGEASFTSLRGQRMDPTGRAGLTWPEPGVAIRITVTSAGQHVTAEFTPGPRRR